MASWQVFFTADAADDLEQLLAYIEGRDSSEQADHVFAQIKNAVLGLRAMPRRGRVVPELKNIGILEYREIFFKPYRILYFTAERKVFVFAVCDGRRNIEELLQRRLMR